MQYILSVLLELQSTTLHVTSPLAYKFSKMMSAKYIQNLLWYILSTDIKWRYELALNKVQISGNPLWLNAFLIAFALSKFL